MLPGHVRPRKPFAITSHAFAVFDSYDHGVTRMPETSRMAKRSCKWNAELVDADGHEFHLGTHSSWGVHVVPSALGKYRLRNMLVWNVARRIFSNSSLPTR